MSRPRDVASFVTKFSSDNGKLDVLVNNAGCMVNTREQTEEGLDKNFATNSLGTFMLTAGLAPLLEQSPAPRVVTVSSGGMLVQKLDTGDLQSTKVRQYYYTENLCCCSLFCNVLTIYPREGIYFIRDI